MISISQKSLTRGHCKKFKGKFFSGANVPLTMGRSFLFKPRRRLGNKSLSDIGTTREQASSLRLAKPSRMNGVKNQFWKRVLKLGQLLTNTEGRKIFIKQPIFNNKCFRYQNESLDNDMCIKSNIVFYHYFYNNNDLQVLRNSRKRLKIYS